MRGALAPHPCQLGRLQCVWSVLAEEYRDILTVFFTSFLFFVWALRPARLDEDEDEEDDQPGRGPSRRRRAKGPAAAARRDSRTTTMPERPVRPRERRRESSQRSRSRAFDQQSQGPQSGLRPGRSTAPLEQAAYTRVKSSSRPASALDAGGPAASPREESLSSADEVRAGLRPGSSTAKARAEQAAYTRVKSSSRLASAFDAGGPATSPREAPPVDEVPASANRERAESRPNSSTPPASGPHELQRCASTLEEGGQGHDAVLLAARLRQGAPARHRRQSEKMQSEASGEKRAGRRPLISRSQSSGSNFYAYLVLKRTASDEQKGKISTTSGVCHDMVAT